MSLYARLAALLAAVLLVLGLGWKVRHTGYEAGKAEVTSQWNAAKLESAREGARDRLRQEEIQRRNRDALDNELAAARAAADRATADADRLRGQAAAAARAWSATLGAAPTGQQCAAAGAAIGVQADVLGRVVQAARSIAAYADASRAAGTKCAADYDATVK